MRIANRAFQKHRVLLPTDDVQKHTAKQNLVYYLTPNSDAMVRCIDGSQKYPPTRYIDLLDQRMQASWNWSPLGFIVFSVGIIDLCYSITI